MKLSALVLMLSLSGGCLMELRAENTKPSFFRWSETNLGKIKSLKYTLTKELNDSGQIWSRKTILEVGSYHRLDYVCYSGDGLHSASYTEALNQDYYQQFFIETQFIRLWKPEVKALPMFIAESFLFSCYDFLHNVDTQINHIHYLKVKAILEKLDSKLPDKISQGLFDDSVPASYFDCEGGISKSFQEKVYYRVYFKTNSGELLGSEVRLSKNSKLLFRYVILKTSQSDSNAQAAPIWYPTHAREYFYGWNEQKLSSKPTHYITYKMSNVEFNQWTEEDATIDPTEAKVIRDEVNKKNIFVPK